jgi:hypothetical protein
MKVTGLQCLNCGQQCGNCGIKSTSRHPVMQVIQLGEGLGAFMLRLRWEAGDYGITWVDFELIEVTAFSQGPDGEYDVPEYQRHGATYSPDTTPDIEQANLAVSGFLKWDGCMQFNVAYVHVDEAYQLAKLLDAIKMARVHAARAMGDAYDLREEG